jgi:type IV secretory pathway TrbF-like protein
MKVEDQTSPAPDPVKKANKKSGDPFGSPPGVPSHFNDQLIDIGILQRVLRSEAAWRRAFTIMAFFGLLMGAGFLVEATKSHTEAVVYKEDVSGDIALIGLTSKNQDPSEPAIVNALRIFISAYRAIPPGDGHNNKDVIELNAKQVEVMTDHDSPADVTYRAFLHDDNPIDLSKKGYARTVTDVEVDKIADLRYRISWRESLRNGTNSQPKTTSYAGDVQLAAAPKVPSDWRLGQINPTGLYVYDTDLRASVLH